MVLKRLSGNRKRTACRFEWHCGFTIFELMIAVAIVTVIFTFAYSSYAEQVQKSRRVEAQAALLELANFMERYYTDTGRYSTTTNEAPPLPFSTLPKTGTPVNYRFSLQEVNQQAYKIVATPVGGAQKDDACGQLSLDHTGTKLPKRAGCWIN